MKRLVPVFPWPLHPEVAAALALVPDITPVEALPGGPGPILAVGKPPAFICDAIVVKSPERVAEAVHIITADKIELVSMRDMVSLAFEGAELVETIVKLPQRVRFQ